MTNMDWLNSLSDEEREKFFNSQYCLHNAPHCKETQCFRCFYKWLNEEHEMITSEIIPKRNVMEKLSVAFDEFLYDCSVISDDIKEIKKYIEEIKGKQIE